MTTCWPVDRWPLIQVAIQQYLLWLSFETSGSGPLMVTEYKWSWGQVHCIICIIILMQQELLITAVRNLLTELCLECDVYLLEININCSTSGSSAYFTAALVYSNPDGTVTASTLINMLLAWLLVEENPEITINNNTTLSLSQQCPTQLNAVTSESCTRLLNHVPSPLMVNKGIDVPLTTGVFFTGIVAGIIISTFLIICIIW